MLPLMLHPRGQCSLGSGAAMLPRLYSLLP
ncbi:hypothetical protein E2C01_071830 [Portunus trituberculatus]|uniref:Uncharacterized protein n=1 Tax=Portunus trituberculatus TaxID=210409 RepID=A0A5B7I914_PORTR|nr:hypothetical protein [Portunus trituberculatus]